jgi:hypothetical protein
LRRRKTSRGAGKELEPRRGIDVADVGEARRVLLQALGEVVLDRRTGLVTLVVVGVDPEQVRAPHVEQWSYCASTSGKAKVRELFAPG